MNELVIETIARVAREVGVIRDAADDERRMAFVFGIDPAQRDDPSYFRSCARDAMQSHNNCGRLADRLFPRLSGSAADAPRDYAELAGLVGEAIESSRRGAGAIFRAIVPGHQFVIPVRGGRAELIQCWTGKYTVLRSINDPRELDIAALPRLGRLPSDAQAQIALLYDVLPISPQADPPQFFRAPLRDDQSIEAELANLMTANLARYDASV
jgi:hypothetical protein